MRGVRETRVAFAQRLQAVVVRGDDGEPRALRQRLRRGARQRRALIGVRARHQLVEEDQASRTRAGPLPARQDVGDARRGDPRTSTDRRSPTADRRCRRARRRRNRSRLRASAATSSPARAISAARPTVFIKTVLPPALGPLTIRIGGWPPPERDVVGDHALRRVRQGEQRMARRPQIDQRRVDDLHGVAVVRHREPRRRRAHVERREGRGGPAQRIGHRRHVGGQLPRGCGATRARISSSVTLSRLLTATSAVGSTNTVSPVRDVSWTMPRPIDFALALRGST